MNHISNVEVHLKTCSGNVNIVVCVLIKLNTVFWYLKIVYCLFVFVALRPMSTAMVIAGRSVHLTTLFPGQA